MDFEKVFPLCYYINLGTAEKRRRHVLNQFWNAGLEVHRFPATHHKHVKHTRGHENAGRCAQALTQKRVFRKARQLGAPSVLIFEDDVVLHPQWREKVADLALPEDWGMFYFGCQHRAQPEPVSPGLVRVKSAWDLHAFAVRAEYFAKVMSVLSPCGKSARCWKVPPSDRQIDELIAEIPTYAAYPNLAWQLEAPSSLAIRWVNDNYTRDGIQRKRADLFNDADFSLPSQRPVYWWPKKTEGNLAERLRGFACMAAFTEISGRGLLGYWPVTDDCPGKFSEGLEVVEGWQLFADRNEWGRATQGVSDYNTDLAIDPVAFYGEFRNKDFLSPAIDEESFLKKYREKVQSLCPLPEVERRVQETLGGLRGCELLGVYLTRKNSDQLQLMEAALDAWKSGKYQAIVLCGNVDNPTHTTLLLKTLQQTGIPYCHQDYQEGDSVETNPSECFFRDITDLFLLSKCRRIFSGEARAITKLAADTTHGWSRGPAREPQSR